MGLIGHRFIEGAGSTGSASIRRKADVIGYKLPAKEMLHILSLKQLWRSQPFGRAKNARMQQYSNFVAS